MTTAGHEVNEVTVRETAIDPPAPGDELAAETLAGELRATRDALLACVEALPESRVYRSTERDGWTLKHELAYLAAADRVLIDTLERLREADGGDSEPLVVAPGGPALRRLYGEAMHVTHELRLEPLREQLAELAESLSRAIEANPAALHRPVALGAAPQPAAEHLRAHIERSEAGVQRLRAVLE